ncbi:MAG: hypothetical protein J7K22_02175 [Nanoarchaeota archaeon]|nr:hypothetical protein [Nanoarchaeota archaeon]
MDIGYKINIKGLNNWEKEKVKEAAIEQLSVLLEEMDKKSKIAVKNNGDELLVLANPQYELNGNTLYFLGILDGLYNRIFQEAQADYTVVLGNKEIKPEGIAVQWLAAKEFGSPYANWLEKQLTKLVNT